MLSTSVGRYDTPILVLGSGITALGVIRSLGRSEIPFILARPDDELPIRSKWYRQVPEYSKTPLNPRDLPKYLEYLPMPKAVLMGCSDDWAQAIAEVPPHLKQQFLTSSPSPQIIRSMVDKWLFSQMLERENVRGPKTHLICSLDELEARSEDEYSNAFLKPLNSQEFSRRNPVKAFQITGKRHAIEIMTRAVRDGNCGFPILLQEYIPGARQYMIDGFIDRNGRVCALIARRRIRMYPTDFGNSTFCETVPIDEVRAAADALRRLMSAIGYRGLFDADFRYDERDGQFKLIEINARPWWFIEFASRCGIDVCRMAYEDALGMPVQPAMSYPAGKRCIYLLPDLAAHSESNPGLTGFFRWLRSVKGASDLLYCWDDPLPGVSATFSAFVRRRRSIHTKTSALLAPEVGSAVEV